MVPRPRIEKLIAAGARGPLTVVTGPPGSGKTVALASWAAAKPQDRPVAWVTLDQFDNRPGNFWSYLVEAIRRVGVVLAPHFPATPTRQPDLFLHQLASTIAVQSPPVTLVLDDIHLLTEPRSLDGLAYVLRNASSGLHLLVASRMDPLLPLHRYRLTGELTEIRANDLSFTEAETALLMSQHNITLPGDLLKVLAHREEGWAAGLRLAAISMSGHPDPAQFVKELDAEHGAIADYLIDEVLNSQPREVRDLLLRTSILERVSVSLAAELTGNQSAAQAIPALAHANAFVEPIGHGWYRYHSLFADVLRLKLRHRAPSEVRDLHHRAARWLRQNGTLREAVTQAAAAHDWPLAARMSVDEFAMGSPAGTHTGEPLADAFEQLRVDASGAGQSEPPLLVVAAMMALRGICQDAASATALLASAESLLERCRADEEIPSRLACTLTRLTLAGRSGDLDAAVAATARAGRLLDMLPPTLLARHPNVRARVLAGRGAVEMWSGDFEAADASLALSASVTREPCDWAYAVGRRALLMAVKASLGRADELARSATEPPWNGRAKTAWLPGAASEVALAWVALERNELAGIQARLSQAQDALRAEPDRLISSLAWLASARHNLAKGHARTAAEMLGRAAQGWAPPPWLDQRLALNLSRALAAAGDIGAALTAAGHAGPPASLTGAMALARARLTGNDLVAAADALAAVAPASVAGAPGHIQLEARLIEAELGYRSGKPERGRQSLLHALKLAEPERLLLPFGVEWAWLKQVLQHDVELAEAFRGLFRAGHPTHQAGTQPPRAGRVASVIVEQLSNRELEVLRLVSKMLTTAEIAEEMYLSVNTVKSHLKSIFRKLGASHRGEAVRQAQRLALL
jgi:LuxR family maltose regulon positive regulatory protein